MATKTPILSICIPTYNREKYLKECLDSIVSQDGFNEEELEIVISDNASTDGTSALISRYQQRYANIRYQRNKENIGAIRNVLQLPDLAKGEYVWYMSDDDMFSDGAFSTMLPLLEDGSSDFLLSQFFGFQNGEKIAYNLIQTRGNITHFTGVSEFFHFLENTPGDIMPYLMLLSIFCFRRSVFLDHLNLLLERHGTSYREILEKDNFIHARIMYIPFGEEKKITLIEKDLVLCRGGNISWTFHFAVYEDLKRFVSDLTRTYHPGSKLVSKMKRVLGYTLFSYIVMVHIKKYLPEKLYNFCIRVGRKVFSLIRILRNHISF